MLNFNDDVKTIIEKAYNFLHTKTLQQLSGTESQERDALIELIEKLSIDHDCCKDWIGGSYYSSATGESASTTKKSSNSGYLYMTSKKVSKSKKKFCEVKNKKLYVYDRECELEPSQIYPIGKGGGYEMKNYKEDKKKAFFDFTSPGNYIIKCETLTKEDGPFWKSLLDPDNTLFRTTECTSLNSNNTSISRDSSSSDLYEDGFFQTSTVANTESLEDNVYDEVAVSSTALRQLDEPKVEILDDKEYDNLYHAIYDSCCDKQDQLLFKRGDILKLVKDYGEWSVAYLKGKYGLVPKNYLRPAYQRV